MTRLTVSIAAVLLVACSHRSQIDQGPLAFPPNTVTSNGLSARVSQPVDFSEIHFGLQGIKYTLQKVILVHPTEGLQVVAVGLVPPGTSAVNEKYPPEVPLAEVPTMAQGPMQVVIAVQADHPGTYDAEGVVFFYTVGGRSYTAYYPQGVRVCVYAFPCDYSSLISRLQQMDPQKVLRELGSD